MPLLMCPNCQSGMKEITRESVQIDICPTCQGVWLDRGELNKLLELNRAEEQQHYAAPPVQQARPQQQYHQPQQHYDPRYQKPYKKKSKLESVFDIFDL